MLDCEDSEKDRNSNCKHCQASGDSDHSQHHQQQRYWDIQLDQDLLETIVSIYPEWFKDCNMNTVSGPMCLLSSDSAKVKQENGEHRTIDKNKESLKVKLMLRRPLNQLVDQGILPSLKSPPAFHEQRQKLERAKMGDILKHKLQKRPDRQELVQQHVLEDSCIDSSLQDKQKQLKKARLADTLNGLISQRPGPSDLVKGNILHTDELLAQAVRESALPFKSPCDTPSPKMRIILDDDSGSDGAFSPSPPYDFSEHSQSSLPSLEASEPSPNPNQGSPCSGVTSFSMSPTSSVSSPLSAVFPPVVSPEEQIAEYLVHHMHHQQQHQQHCNKESTTPNKNRKKTKPKTQPKARTIKFHEYRGPPNAPKNSTASTSSTLTDSHSELWLQQQQLFLRLQQECLQTHSQVVHNNQVNTVQKPTGDQIVQTIQKPQTPNQTHPLFESPNSPQKLLSNFEDLKVTDLRAELKKKGLPVSGSKPQLIKRLRSHVPSGSSPPPQSSQSLPSSTHTTLSSLSPSPHTITVDSILLDSLNTIPSTNNVINNQPVEMTAETIKDLLSTMSDSIPAAIVSMDGENLELGEISDSSSTSLSNEDIVQLQQIWIEKLQRDLERSRKQLQQCQIPAVTSPVVNVKPTNSTPPPKAPPPATNTLKTADAPSIAENKVAQRQIIHQILQQKIQQQELQKAQRQQGTINSSTSSSSNPNSTLTALLKSSPLNASPLNIDLTSVTKIDLDLNSATKPVTSFPGSIMTTQVQESKTDLLTEDDFPTIALQVNGTAMGSTPSEQDDFPGTVPIFVCHADSLQSKTTVPPNALNSRSSSLPSFSALLSKAPPARSNTDPQFQIARPPPNYSEATRQLKVKQQHHLTPDGSDGNPRQSKKHKSSIKSQAVDDVLEILINNGELSPSAAHEPTTPITPVSSSSDQSSLSIFQSSATNEPFFSKPSLLSSSLAASSSAKDVITNATDLRLAQSLMDLTPPSSTGFADTGCAPSNSLDFDFPLDMTDIDTMELEGLDSGHQVPSSLDPTLSISMIQEVKPSSLDFVMSKSTELANHLMRLTEMSDLQDRVNDRGIDNDIIEFLGDFEETSGHSSVSNNFHHSSSFGITHDNDPLFSNGHDALDFFSGDDMDFKPQHDLNFPLWGENTT